MESTSLNLLLKGLCDYSIWNYAVFWRLNHNVIPMALTWEDGCFSDPKSKEALDSIDEIFTSSWERNAGDDGLGECSAQYLLTLMSHLQYNIGEGFVGQVASTGNYCWVSSDNFLAGELSTNLVSEYPYEWLLQFSSGIKTILLIPVLPYGVLQLSSFEVVEEDLRIVHNVRERFNIIHLIIDGTGSSSPGSNIQAQSFSFQAHDLMNNLDDFSTFTTESLQGDLSMCFSILNQNLLSNVHDSFDIPVKDFPQFLGVDSQNVMNFPSHETSNNSIHIQLEILENELLALSHLEEKSNTSSKKVNNRSEDRMASNGAHSCTDGDSAGYKYVNSSLNFPSECELHKSLENPSQQSNTGYLLQSCTSADDIYQNSGLILLNTDHNGTETSQYAEGGDVEYRLESVVGNLCRSTDGSLANISNSFMTSTTTAKPKDKLITDNPWGHVKSEFVSKDLDVSTSPPASATSSSISCITMDKQKEGIQGNEQPKSEPKVTSTSRKRPRSGDSQRPRPRDRQLIQDRVKVLRELVPNGAKCSIDGLLHRTIQHMYHLRDITKQAEKLKHLVHSEVPECKKLVSAERKNRSHPGRSCALDLGNGQQICPLVIEDLSHPEHMLIEMICEDHGVFLDIAQVIQRMELTILKGVLERRLNNTWASFIVEVPKGFHRMDVFWPLMHLLQRRNKRIRTCLY